MTHSARMRQLAASHRRLLRAVTALTDDMMREPTRLPGWTRDLLIAHLRFGAEAALRGVQSAADGTGAVMYPGGEQQRDQEISSGLGRPAAELTRVLADACTRLETALEELEPPAWDAEVQTRRGPVPVSEVVLQRWLDVEAHHVDLDVGYTPRDWPEDLVSEFLPALVAMLPALHARPDADREVRGSWVLQRTDAVGQWTVTADGDRAWCGPPTVEPVDALNADGASLLALLLGRLEVAGSGATTGVAEARKLKAAFPGP